MANKDSTKSSFSAAVRWRVASQVFLGILSVAAVVFMVNYLGSRYYKRFYLSAQTNVQLSERTRSILRTLTNDVTVTVYFDRENELFPTVSALLKEYQLASPRISVRTVDYNRDPALAEKIKEQYSLTAIQYAPGEKIEKDVVIFDNGGHFKIVPGKALASYQMEVVSNDGPQREFRNRPVQFNGEVTFTSMLLAVSNPKPFMAYFLQGHGEPRLDDDKSDIGFGKLVAVLQQNYIRPEPLTLNGTNMVPNDCNILVVAGVSTNIPSDELAKLDQYLNEGGRMLALVNFSTVGHPTGLERTLATWGVAVGDSTVQDPERSLKGLDVVVTEFTDHPLLNALQKSKLHLVLPRSVGAIDPNIKLATAPKVSEVAFTSAKAFEERNPSVKRRFPLMVAVEKGSVEGVVTERGATRLIVVGDSIFLGNQMIESAANRDFASYAVNWLLNRDALLQGLGPRPVVEYRVVMTRQQLRSVQWILLGAMPGGVLLLGGLVWLRRRK